MNTQTVAIKDLNTATYEHLVDRLLNRINASDKEIAARMLCTVENVKTLKDYVLAYNLGHDRVSANWLKGKDDSNGQVICLIVRNGEPRTFLYRRIGQDFSERYFNVTKVYKYNWQN